MQSFTQLLIRSLYFILFYSTSFGLSAQNVLLPDVPRNPVRVQGKVVIKVKKEAVNAFSPASVENRFRAVGIKKCNAHFADMIPRAKTDKFSEKDRYGIGRIYQIDVTEGFSVENIISYFKSMAWVEYAEPVYENFLLAPPFVPNDPYIVDQWHLTNINAFPAWGIANGSPSVVIGIIDTGVNHRHPDLITQRFFNNTERFGVGGFDDDGNGFIDDSLGYDFGDFDAVALDPHYHGTGVAGVAAARANNTEGIAGSAFNCSFMPLKVMNSAYSIVNTMDAVLYGAENGCHVLNLSLGRIGGYLQWEQDIFNYVVNVKNVAVVAAAGNTYGELDFYPASYFNVLSVAHSMGDDSRIPTGTFSTNVDLMAPGAGIWTSYNYDYIPYYYYPMTGSSFASPLTAGVTALVRAHYPDLTAAQAMQLVRVTADNVYALPNNAPYFDKLGYGRLNAFRALDERPTAKAARMFAFSAKNSLGEYIFPGDTVEITADFTNYLAATSSAFRITLRSASPYITVLDSVFDAGSMATLEEKNNSLQKFKVLVSAAVPRDHLAKMRLSYSDAAYSDFQYFTLNCNMSYIHLNINDIGMTIGNNATVGYYDRYYLKGKGVQRYGTEILKEAGLIIGRDSVKLSDAVIRNFASAIREENFKYTPHPSGYANPRISENTPLNIKAETYFTDTVANPNAVGVFVKQTVSGRRNAPHRKYVIFEYDIKNISAAAFDSLNVGIFADWDIQDAVNLANWDNIGKFGYIYKDTSYTAIKVLSTTAFNHFAFDVVSSSASGNINILDSFTKGEKWRAASGGLARNFAGTLSGPSGNNTAHYVGTSIANITPGESRKVYFAFLIGNSLADLRQSAIEAQNAVNPSVSPIPVFTDSVFCSGEPFLISPSGGTNFAFYSPWNPITPLHIGNSYLIPADSVLNTFLVTCRDSVVESAPRWINFDLVTPTVDFSAPASVVIPDVSSVSFTSLATSAVSWTWDFGNDTFSNLENPSAVYTSSGVYMVTLTATDNNGCTGSVSKSITVARRSPTPVITPVYHFVCWEENVVISPLNGSIFKFYKNSALTQLVSQGNSVSVHDPMIQSVWITCIDSLLESLPVKVDIRRSYVRAEFQAAPIFDTVLYADVNFNDFSVSDLSLVQWEWNFGDGTAFSSDRNPEHTYSTQGIYEVTLRARNSKGCWGEIKRKFKVGKRSPVPILRDYAADVCVGGYAYMFPLNGTKYNYYTDVALSDKIYSGKNYAPLITESTPNVFYITCADSLIESAPTAFRINKKQAVADFEYPREVLMHINNRASFIDLSKDAVEWEWDFGNGSVAYNKNPTAIYRGQGTYTVKLKIKNSSGCFAAVSKKIVVVNKSPEPQVPSYKICSNDKVHIKPTGGKVFKFYTDEFAPKHIHVGNSYETPRLGKNTTYFITCVDSAIESSAVRCEIILSRPISNFTMSEDSLNLFRTDTVFFRDQSQFAKRWLWNFDNGKNAFVPNTFSRYFNKRHYRVSLITFDSLNCLDTMRKTLIVYDSAVVASLNPDDEYDFAIFPIPAKDRINIAFSKYGHKPITYTLTNATGMSVLKVSEHFSVLSFETISTAHLPRGLYILRLKIGEKIFNRKIVLD